MSDASPSRAVERACAWLAAAYPRAFRDRFEAGMRDALAEDYALARREGLRARVAFWIASAFDAMRFGLAGRFASAGPPQRDPSRPKGAVMSAFRVDLRDAWRSLRATPVVAAICVLSLALGIGANTALFSILNSLLLKSLPVQDPARLVLIDDGSWTNPIWEQIRDRQSEVFDGAFAWCSLRFDLSMHGESDFVPGAYASGDMFEVLGVAPVLGRTFTARDDVRGGGPDGPVAVISESLWRQRFGGTNDVIGRTITLSRQPFTIIGVLPAHFFGPEIGRAGDVIVPIATEAIIDGAGSMLDKRSAWWLDIMARLKPGQTIDAAATALRGIQPQVRAATIPENWGKKDQNEYLSPPFTLVSAATGESNLRTKFERPLTILLVVVGLVLVIACANIANLLIARASARRHELSLRLALGATRWRIAAQLLLESLILALAGAAAGLFIAQWASQLLVRQLATSASTVTLDLAIDWRVLMFTTGVAVVTAVIFGLAPAAGVGRIAPSEALKERGRGVTGDARFGVRNMLVIAQIGLSLALVVGAGLFVHTFATLTSRPAGFNADGLLLAQVDVRRSAVAPDGRLALYERLREAAAAVPGVSMVTASIVTPVGNIRWNMEVDVPDGPKLVGRERLSWVNAITPGWFATYGTRLEGGRDFDERDRKGAPAVAIVNDAFVRKFFPNVASPIGRTFNERLPDASNTSYEIVGVVEDSAYTSLRSEPSPIVYEPLAQTDDAKGSALSYSLRVRSTSTAGITRALASAFENVDGGVSVRFETLASQLRSSLTQERLLAMLAGFFGALALVLSALGLYGVTSYAVGRRRAEIGIRLALGATRGGIVTLVLGRVGWLVGLGIAGGAALSLWLAKYVSTLLYGVQSRDPWTLAGAATVLGAVGLLAGWLPAHRASRVDPTTALRTE